MRFAPTLGAAAVRREAARVATRAAEARARADHEAALRREREAQEQAQVRMRRTMSGPLVGVFLHKITLNSCCVDHDECAHHCETNTVVFLAEFGLKHGTLCVLLFGALFLAEKEGKGITV